MRIFLSFIFCTTLLVIGFGANKAQAQDQLGCRTQDECFVQCCPNNTPTCQQTCRNLCPSMSQPTCPSFYFFCPYNTFVAQYNWLELRNLNSSTKEGSIAFYRGNGSVFEFEPFEVDSLARRDFDIHSMVGPSSIGQVVVQLNGDSDALNAAVSYYEIDGSGVRQTVTRECTKVARETP